MESFHFLTAQNEKNGAVRQSVQSHFHVFRLRPYDLGVPELFVVLVVFTVGFAVGVAVAVLVVPAAVAVVVAALAATFGCSSQFLASVNDERSCHYNNGTDNQYGEPNCIATR